MTLLFFFAVIMLVELHDELLDNVLSRLDAPDLARLRAVCHRLNISAGELLEPWHSRAVLGPDNPWSVRLFRHLLQLKNALLTDPVDESRWRVVEEHCIRMAWILGLECTSWASTIEMIGRGWTISLVWHADNDVSFDMQYIHEPRPEPFLDSTMFHNYGYSLLVNMAYFFEGGVWKFESRERKKALDISVEDCDMITAEVHRAMSRLTGVLDAEYAPVCDSPPSSPLYVATSPGYPPLSPE